MLLSHTNPRRAMSTNLLPYDFFDPEIRAMVMNAHYPHESWSEWDLKLIPAELPRLVSIACAKCGHGWPCPSRLQLNDFLAQEQKFDQVQQMIHEEETE
jgi:hypothetical protein